MLSSFSSFSKAIFFASSILCISTPVFASKAIGPCADDDLVEQGKDPAFNNVIHISIEKAGGLASCSASKVRIFSRRTPLYLTAAHCLKGALSIWDHAGRKISGYAIHPFFALNPLADMAFFEIEGENLNDGYLLYQGDIQSVPIQSLLSVGYGGKWPENGISSRRAFYAGRVVFDAFSINQQHDGLYPKEKKMCRGIAEHGDSGSPLFVKREDGAYEIVGVTYQVSIASYVVDYTKWARIDSHFVEAVMASPEAMGEYMLKRSAKTWEEMATLLQSNPLVQYAWGMLRRHNGDNTQSFGWYMKAANQGCPLAQFNLGAMYGNGEGVGRSDRESVKWYIRAANQGYAPAQYKLGVMYGSGRGVTQSAKEAVKWYTRAADQGYTPAQYNLGVMYAMGEGVAQSDGQATQWFKKSANQDHPKAQYNLAVMYASGRGVAQDDQEAIKWYAKAANQGLEPAKEALRIIKERLAERGGL